MIADPALTFDADILVVVDDWKSADTGSPDAPVFYTGRQFRVADPQLPMLISSLSGAGAADWHASGSRAKHSFLFSVDAYPEIAARLNGMDSALWAMLVDAQDLRAPHIGEQWRRFLEEDPDLKAVWSSEPQATGFFRFIDYLIGFMSHRVSDPVRVRVISDTLDWLTGLPHDGGLVEIVRSHPPFELEVVMIADKQGERAQPYLPLLGLVDSEAWAFGRLQSLQISEQTTIRDRSMTWRDAGADPTIPIFTQDEFDHALAPHRQHPNLLHYWGQFSLWLTAGRVTNLNDRNRPDRVVLKS